MCIKKLFFITGERRGDGGGGVLEHENITRVFDDFIITALKDTLKYRLDLNISVPGPRGIL